MNLYKLHSNPESLHGYDVAREKVPELAWETHKRNHGKLRELEDTWTKSAQYSYWYARFVLENRFPKGEDAIATDDLWSYRYAKNILKPLGIIGFPQGEDAIATSGRRSCEYAENVLEDRFPKGEDAIATDAWSSYLYARDVLKPLGIKGFPQGEDAIATSAEYSYLYARDILKDRFLKGEDAIRGSRGSRYQKYYEELFGVKL